MRNPLILIEAKESEGKPINIITNDFQRSCTEIAKIYCRRWQIEIFLKWLKQNLEIKHLWGFSPRGGNPDFNGFNHLLSLASC